MMDNDKRKMYQVSKGQIKVLYQSLEPNGHSFKLFETVNVINKIFCFKLNYYLRNIDVIFSRLSI